MKIDKKLRNESRARFHLRRWEQKVRSCVKLAAHYEAERAKIQRMLDESGASHLLEMEAAGKQLKIIVI